MLFWIIRYLIIYFCLINYLHAGQVMISDRAEEQLLSIIELVQQQNIDQAMKQSELLLKKFPTFTLAQVLRADLLKSKYAQIQNPADNIRNDTLRKNYLSEISARIAADQQKIKTHSLVPENIKYISSDITHFFVFDFSLSRMYLFQNSDNGAYLIADHYITIGKEGSDKQIKGDNKTPIGVYKIVNYLDDNRLPELYGWGAFPINYPNHWDKLNHRTGSGIWLHGMPRDIYSRPPNDSEGCVVISNHLLKNLSSYMNKNTPVILADHLNWQKEAQTNKKNNDFLQHLMAWKKSWQTKSLDDYIDFYAKKFNNQDKNYAQWKAHKKRIFGKTRKISLELSKISIIQYPSQDNLLSVHFYQIYQGDKYHSKGFKQQYWQKNQQGKWQIIYEKM